MTIVISPYSLREAAEYNNGPLPGEERGGARGSMLFSTQYEMCLRDTLSQLDPLDGKEQGDFIDRLSAGHPDTLEEAYEGELTVGTPGDEAVKFCLLDDIDLVKTQKDLATSLRHSQIPSAPPTTRKEKHSEAKAMMKLAKAMHRSRWPDYQSDQELDGWEEFLNHEPPVWPYVDPTGTEYLGSLRVQCNIDSEYAASVKRVHTGLLTRLSNVVFIDMTKERLKQLNAPLDSEDLATLKTRQALEASTVSEDTIRSLRTRSTAPRSFARSVGLSISSEYPSAEEVWRILNRTQEGSVEVSAEESPT